MFCITLYSSMQIFKFFEDWEVIVSSVQTETPKSISKLGKMTESSLTSITFGNCISTWKLGDGICKST
jgi:hypothetical protein